MPQLRQDPASKEWVIGSPIHSQLFPLMEDRQVEEG
jgi:hypothetical protein